MCGIAGRLAYDDPPVKRGAIEQMLGVIRHRGPDDLGTVIDGEVGLGCCRLSIIDVEGGHQPMGNEAGSVLVVCNGEIYNHVELRKDLEAEGHSFRTHSDVEVIVHAYEEEGTDCLNRLRGMFALALWDARRKMLLLARDRFGIKPLYYAQTRSGLEFGSEQKAILAASSVSREISLSALSQLFTMGFVVSPETMFAGIRQVEPGTYMVCQGKQISTGRYWELRYPNRDQYDSRVSTSQWAGKLSDKLDETVGRHLRSDVPVGAWLSGGLDSSAIVALMGRNRTTPIHVTTLGFSDDRIDEFRGQHTLLDHQELNLVRREAICDGHGLDALPDAVWYFEAPTTSGIEIPRSQLGEASAKDGKVVLTGEGADEIFGGYGWFHLDRFLRPLSTLPHSLRRLLLLGRILPARFPRASAMVMNHSGMGPSRYQVCAGFVRREPIDFLFSEDVRCELAGLPDPVWTLELPPGFDRWHPFCQLQYMEIGVRLPSFIIPTLDRGSMAHSVEARVPFLDHELVELVSQIPPSLKMRCTTEKYILRLALSGLLPEEILRRRKRGLRAPLRGWMHRKLPEFARDELSTVGLRRTQLFDPKGVERILAEQRAGTRDWSRELYGVLWLQLWNRIFVRGERPPDLPLAAGSGKDQ